MSTRRIFVIKVVLPFLFASVMCVIFYGTQHDKFPKDASAAEWEIFMKRVLVDVRHADKAKIMLLVVLAHVGHTVFCVPCVHLTQMLAGYTLGFVFAFVLCAICECTVVTIYVLAWAARNTFAQDDFEEFVVYLRGKHMLFPFIFMTLMSSVPINSSSCIIGFGEVTPREFVLTHYVVSTINSCKCCFLGHQIRVAASKAVVITLGYIIFVISVLPTLITAALWYLTFVVYRRSVLTPCSEHLKSAAHPSHGIQASSSPCVLHFGLEQLLSRCPLFATHDYNILHPPPAPNDVTAHSLATSSPRQSESADESNTLSITTFHVDMREEETGESCDVQITEPNTEHDPAHNALPRTCMYQTDVGAGEYIRRSTETCVAIVVDADAPPTDDPRDSAHVHTNAPLQIANMVDSANLPAVAVLAAVLGIQTPECPDCLEFCKTQSPQNVSFVQDGVTKTAV